MTRLCTSPSSVTRMASTRSPDRGRNSIWRKALRSRRGNITTPARRVTPERTWEAVAIRAGESSRAAKRRRISSTSVSAGGSHRQQGVEEETVARDRRHPARGGVEGGHQAQILQVGHDIAHRGRTQLQPGVLRQGTGTHGLSIPDIAFNQDLEKMQGPIADRTVTLCRQLAPLGNPTTRDCATSDPISTPFGRVLRTAI